MEEGDLQAVVKGCTNFDPNWFTTTTKQEDVDFDFIYSSSFTDLLETSRVLDELEELYKPFYPNTILSSSSSSISDHNFTKRQTDAEKLKRDEKPVFIGSSTPVSAASTSSHLHHETKYKRRKNQQKKVVHQVAAQGVPSDTWAWRKYGQKPIKGSPYPSEDFQQNMNRSYYRCSSLKGCLARKLVERSPSNPEMLVITYTADHCHPRPTKKSCLAGTTRQKFTSVSRTAAAAATMTGSPISPAASTTLSPPLTSSATMEDSELSPLGFNNGRANGGEEDQLMYDVRLEGGFFNGLDDLRYDPTYSSCVSQQDQYPVIYPTCW